MNVKKSHVTLVNSWVSIKFNEIIESYQELLEGENSTDESSHLPPN